MSENSQRISKSCVTMAVVIGIFIGILVIIGIGLVIYSLQIGGI